MEIVYIIINALTIVLLELLLEEEYVKSVHLDAKNV
jgi:hypothetical protein